MIFVQWRSPDEVKRNPGLHQNTRITLRSIRATKVNLIEMATPKRLT